MLISFLTEASYFVIVSH